MQLDELREVVELVNDGSAPCQTVRNLLAEKRADVARRIEELREFDKMLATLELSEGSDGTEECAILKRAEHRHALRERLRSRNVN